MAEKVREKRDIEEKKRRAAASLSTRGQAVMPKGQVGRERMLSSALALSFSGPFPCDR